MSEYLLHFIENDKSYVIELVVLFSAIASFIFTLSKARLITAKKDEIYSELSRDFAKDVQKRNEQLATQNREFSQALYKLRGEVMEIKVENEQLAKKLMDQEKVMQLQAETIKLQEGKMEAMQDEIVRIQRQNLEYRAGINILFDQISEAGIKPRYIPAS